jgi:hypothetical protein
VNKGSSSACSLPGADCTHARPFRVQANEGWRRGGRTALLRHARGSVSFNTVGPHRDSRKPSPALHHFIRVGAERRLVWALCSCNATHHSFRFKQLEIHSSSYQSHGDRASNSKEHEVSRSMNYVPSSNRNLKIFLHRHYWGANFIRPG